MNYSIVLAIGIVVGFILGRGQTPPPEKILMPAQACETPAQPAPESVHVAPKFKVTTSSTVIRRLPAVARPAAPDSGRVITLTNQVVREMENNWNDLRQQIHLAREQDGWVILELQRNSIFSRAGFVQGDLITNKAIESLRDREPGTGDLPERFSRILGQLTN